MSNKKIDIEFVTDKNTTYIYGMSEKGLSWLRVNSGKVLLAKAAYIVIHSTHVESFKELLKATDLKINERK